MKLTKEKGKHPLIINPGTEDSIKHGSLWSNTNPHGYRKNHGGCREVAFQLHITETTGHLSQGAAAFRRGEGDFVSGDTRNFLTAKVSHGRKNANSS